MFIVVEKAYDRSFFSKRRNECATYGLLLMVCAMFIISIVEKHGRCYCTSDWFHAQLFRDAIIVEP